MARYKVGTCTPCGTPHRPPNGGPVPPTPTPEIPPEPPEPPEPVTYTTGSNRFGVGGRTVTGKRCYTVGEMARGGLMVLGGLVVVGMVLARRRAR